MLVISIFTFKKWSKSPKLLKFCCLRLAVVLFLLCPTDSRARYRFPFLYKPHRPSPVHHFNFVANGHPYKITVNNKVSLVDHCLFIF